MNNSNRVIKFRVWVGRHDGGGTMINEPTVGETGADFVEINNMFKTGKNTEYGGGFTAKTPNWMQFTGLKDKNGKEVFQGDILKVQSAKEDYGSCSYGGFLKVVALTCGYTLEPFNPTLKEIEDKGELWDSSSLWHIRESKYIEVIGNIYENPNLLKK